MAIPILEKKPVKALQIIAKQAMHAEGVDLNLRSQVVVGYDISTSTDDRQWPQNRFYSRGIMSGVSRRVIAVTLKVDDDGILPVYGFHHDVVPKPEMTEANFEDYIEKNFPLRSIGGGTAYAPIIKRIAADAQPGEPMLAIIFTDGANNDHGPAATALREVSNIPIFYLWLGIHTKGRELSDKEEAHEFPFLADMDNLPGRVIDNAGFCSVSIDDITDTDLYRKMFREYKGFHALCAANNVTWANKSSGGSGHSQQRPSAPPARPQAQQKSSWRNRLGL